MPPFLKRFYFLISTSLLGVTPASYASSHYDSLLSEEATLHRSQTSISIKDEKISPIDDNLVFLTPIDQIEAMLRSTSYKRLIIGGLHVRPKDMKDFWILSQESDIVINTDIMSKPDIKLNALTSEELNNLTPLILLLQKYPNLRFNEIVLEHVGFSTDLENLIKSPQILIEFTEMLIPGGSFRHQSSFMAMKQSDGIWEELPKELSFQSSFDISQNFGGLISYAEYDKLPGHSSQKLDESEYNRLAALKRSYDSTRPPRVDLHFYFSEEELERYRSDMEKIWTSKKNPLVIFNERTNLNKTLLLLFKSKQGREDWQERIERRDVEWQLLRAFPGNKLVYSSTSFVDKLIKELTPGSSIFIDPTEYDIDFKSTSILLKYLKNIEN